MQSFVFDGVAFLGIVASVAACRFWIECVKIREEVRRLNRALRGAEDRRKEDSVKAYNAGRRGGKR
jgi:hypothetical protein